MSLPITTILSTATTAQLAAADAWVCDQLHVHESTFTQAVAVAYVRRHFEQGALSGWDGFVEALGADAR